MKRYNVGKRERKIISYILRELNRKHILRINGLPLIYSDPIIMKCTFTFVCGINELYFYVRCPDANQTLLFIPFSDIKEIRVNYIDIII